MTGPVVERPAPIVLVPAPAGGGAPFGSFAAVAEAGQHLLATELSRRLARAGAAVLPIAAQDPGSTFHWGRWFAAAARRALEDAAASGRVVDTIGYAGAGSMALASDEVLDQLLSPIPGEVIANNRYSADAFVVSAAPADGRSAPDGTTRIGPGLDRAIERLDGCPADNTAVRCLESAGFRSRDLAGEPWTRFDVDTPLDLALLRVATRLPGLRRPTPALAGFLEMARLPGDRPLEVPHLDGIGAVIRSRSAQLVVAGRVPTSVLAALETDTACRVRAFVEERGMRSARDVQPRSLLARWVEQAGAAGLVAELARLGDGVILDTRVLMAALAGSSDASAWPPAEERFASDFADPQPITTTWLRELVDAVLGAPVPFMLGGHALISDGLRLVVAAAWNGR